MSVAILIPARYSSSRFEGKVLARIGSKTMVRMVYEAVRESKYADFVAVLTDDRRVVDEVNSFGGSVFEVKGNFNSGTDRIAAFVKNNRFDYIVNMQADEPLIDADTVDRLIECIMDSNSEMATLVSKAKEEELDDKSVVKVVVDNDGYALYFSRSRIPFNRNPFDGYLKHVGIYAYSFDALMKLSSLTPSSLELAEGLEQLRALQNGIRIKTCMTDKFLIGVDTREDLKKVLRYLEIDDG
ncbi:3-deoxy-manno-octulosonate cytidylyltransferase [Hippea alviniae]|uniref:3-deoxy-manno-octulosonate cytidylyltransferase n=1 Tax=Hippea alviniae TaxID=1279027 RepID=UPI0003B7855B|nr:3-deoxy-manno-octulosonate cytidylyltransferase [Hippea alviniae]